MSMEVEDSEQAREAYRASTLPIDLEHREVMEEVLTDAPPVEELLDVSMTSQTVEAQALISSV